jgi:predicted CopG family antitoxin
MQIITTKTIRISEETYYELAKRGTLENSFDSVIRSLLTSAHNNNNNGGAVQD